MLSRVDVALDLVVIISGLSLFGLVAVFTALNTVRARRGEAIPERRRGELVVPALGLVLGVSMIAAALASDGGTPRNLQFASGIALTAAWTIMVAGKRFLLRPRQTTTAARLAELGTRIRRSDEIQAELRKGNRLRAIKLYRDDTGASLAEAADGVDDLAHG